MISVTHRLSSVVNADRVFLLDQGRLVEEGRHTELLSAGGLYAKLWRKQSGVQANAADAVVRHGGFPGRARDRGGGRLCRTATILMRWRC